MLLNIIFFMVLCMGTHTHSYTRHANNLNILLNEKLIRCVGLLADNVWVDSETVDELWSRWMDWDSKERVRSCHRRIFHSSIASLFNHLPQSHQGAC